jgi:prepilin-type N-terminal cleavage/methylation domain-containing protein
VIQFAADRSIFAAMKTPPARAAFTLPEVLLAVMLFSVGILGLASTATFLVAQSGKASVLTEAGSFTGTRLDSLRATPCASLTSGSASFAHGTLVWSVAPAPRSRSVRATLTLARRGTALTTAFDQLLPCDR